MLITSNSNKTQVGLNFISEFAANADSSFNCSEQSAEFKKLRDRVDIKEKNESCAICTEEQLFTSNSAPIAEHKHNYSQDYRTCLPLNRTIEHVCGCKSTSMHRTRSGHEVLILRYQHDAQ